MNSTWLLEFNKSTAHLIHSIKVQSSCNLTKLFVTKAIIITAKKLNMIKQ